MNLKIEYLKKELLKPYANNAKLHPAEQVEQIKRSIEEFGFNDPIAIWGDNEIVEGHGRLLAVMEISEIETVPVIRLDDLTDEQRRAYTLIHNKLTMNTGFDFDVLGEELSTIVDIDMSDLGFSEDEIIELTVNDSYISESTGGSNFDDSFIKELEEYEKNANENILVNKRVILIYRNDEEMQFIKNILKIPEEEELNVVYDIKKIINKEQESNAESKE